MLSTSVIVAVLNKYLGTLFGIARYADRRADAGRSLVSSGWVYALSLAVYATSWTYYGSVGRAASTGVGFLPIYLGATLTFAVGWLVLRKIIRISRQRRITSLSDFVSARYGNSVLLGALVTVVAVVGLIPYIALQLKAVSNTFTILRQYPALTSPAQLGHPPVVQDTGLYVALLLAVFAILFGTRHLDAGERHEGMVAAVAFESIVKLVAFLALGLFVTFGMLGGLGNLLDRAAADPATAALFTVAPDTFVLALPMAQRQQLLALVVFIGGLSASTAMVIMETVALATMVSNSLVAPGLLRGVGRRVTGPRGVGSILLTVRRVTIVAVVLLGYGYFRLAGEGFTLVSIGLVSFAAVAQFAPALLGGLYWRGGSRRGALTGLVGGFVVWAYTLPLPTLVRAGWLPRDLLDRGPWGIGLLRPEKVLGLTGLDPVSHGLVWSMVVNVGCFVGVSLWGRRNAAEYATAAAFVDALRQAPGAPGARLWRGSAQVGDLRSLLERYLGPEGARDALQPYLSSRELTALGEGPADAELVHHIETVLAGAVGTASARVLVSSVVDEEPPGVDEG